MVNVANVVLMEKAEYCRSHGKTFDITGTDSVMFWDNNQYLNWSFSGVKDTISVTRHFIFDCLSDIYPIIKPVKYVYMISILAMMKVGCIYETCRSGSASKYVQKCVWEVHIFLECLCDIDYDHNSWKKILPQNSSDNTTRVFLYCV